MRIPLDLYQILSVPMQAKPEQLQQAFEDRQQQLPRSQYTEAAIAMRNQLLKQAYAVLSKEESRTTYDRTLRLERSPTSDTNSELSPETTEAVGMALADHQLVGGLLLLQEMGQYSTILKLGTAYLDRPIDLNHVPSPDDISEADVILSMALAYLESGREYWQQQQFVAAATALQQGSDLLTHENLFPEINQEIQIDLHKLRPYQVLQLLSLAKDDPERQQGLSLLQTMLDQRGGIEGHEDDQSGLGIDDFLRFVQQLRGHLTVEEQQNLFQQEAQRPSAVASYLNSYALVAGGFSQGKPAQIKAAQTLLNQLSNRQDTYIEQAMCSLLLGQPNRSVQTLPLSQDEDSLAFIRQYSEEDEDDIPGLFLYTEHWLQQEVYPYFRDLADQNISLQDYFNDPKIQMALCTLDLEAQAAPIISPPSPTPPTPADPSTEDDIGQVVHAALGKPQSQEPPSFSDELQALQSVNPQDYEDIPSPWTTEQGDTANSIQDRAIFTDTPTQSPVAPSELRKRPPEVLRQNSAPKSPRPRRPARRQSKASLGWLPWAGVLVLGLVSIGGVAALVFRDSGQPQADISPTPTAPSPKSEEPKSTATSPQPLSAQTDSPGQGLSKDAAYEVIKSWQTIKAAGRGKSHDFAQFKQILLNPRLSNWTQQAKRDQDNDTYYEYQLHELKVEKIDSTGDSQAAVYVEIEETANQFVKGKKGPKSYEKDQYRVRYDLTKQQDKWWIMDWKVL